MDKKCLVLIIEDNQDFQDLYGTTAEMAGYEVEHIYDGNDALERLEHEPIPTIILLDARLPSANGFEILQATRSKKGWSKVPIYILTADIRATQPFRTSIPQTVRADGIIEKGVEAISRLRELFARLRNETDNQ